jgi:hypothetical protein
MATLTIARGTFAGMGDLEQKCQALVERISGYPMSEEARARILAEVEAAYRRERSARARHPPGLAADRASAAGPGGHSARAASLRP